MNADNNEIGDIISIVSDNVNVLNQDVQRTQREFTSLQHDIETINEQSSLCDILAQGMNNRTLEMEAIQNATHQEYLSAIECAEHKRLAFFDGSYTWNITDICTKRMDAKSERQKSIYSPAFYSSLTDYNMYLRLYLNGDGNTRDTHMSLFLVPMHSRYDAILRWPLTFKVTFTLINQLSFNDSPINSFCPDITSACFQQPTMNMNIAYGIPRFFPLNQFEQNYSQYVQNDTLFIKVTLDFLSETPVLPLSLGVNASPNDDEHTGVIDENLPI